MATLDWIRLMTWKNTKKNYRAFTRPVDKWHSTALEGGFSENTLFLLSPHASRLFIGKSNGRIVKFSLPRVNIKCASLCVRVQSEDVIMWLCTYVAFHECTRNRWVYKIDMSEIILLQEMNRCFIHQLPGNVKLSGIMSKDNVTSSNRSCFCWDIKA